LLDKVHGAVTCAHCQALGADEQCPYCQRMVHAACMAGEGCPVPHPVEIRLGRGKRLRAIDETGRFGAVGGLLGGVPELKDLAAGLSIDAPPDGYNGLSVAYLGGWALGREIALRAAATFYTREIGDGQYERVYVDPLLYRARATPHGLQAEEFVARSPQPLGHRLRVSRDNHWAVFSGDSRLDVIDLQGRLKPRKLDLKGQMIFDLAVSSAMDLVAVAQWGQLTFFGLSDGWRLGRLRREDDDFTWVGLGGGKAAYITASKRYAVYRVERKVMPDRWELLAEGKLKVKGPVRDCEASLTPDGRLLAVRRRRKEVLVLDLAEDTEQRLGRHTDRINQVKWINNGRRLVTSDDDNRVVFWPRDEGRIISGGTFRRS